MNPHLHYLIATARTTELIHEAAQVRLARDDRPIEPPARRSSLAIGMLARLWPRAAGRQRVRAGRI